MHHTNTILILLILALFACQHKPEAPPKNYVLVDDGVLVEQFDSTIVDENKYNWNNEVYQVGNRFTYRYEHLTPNKEIKYFCVKGNAPNEWEFVGINDTQENIVHFVEISVANGNPMSKNIPDYNQTCLTYTLDAGKGFSMSGAIENEGNVWIHPPRAKYFRILELNPFPYIKAPYEIGTQWTWDLRIGAAWGDARWKIWEGGIENQYVYEITDQIRYDSALGAIDCWVVESSAQSRIGETSLTAYFHEQYGFVKLAYTNIDGSNTNLELVGYEQGSGQ